MMVKNLLRKSLKTLLLLLLLIPIKGQAATGARWHPPVRNNYWLQQKQKKEELALAYEVVNRLFQKKFNERERKFFNDLCWAEYKFSYYKTLQGFLHSTEIEYHRNDAKESLLKLKRHRMHAVVFKKAGGDKACLTRYILHRVEAGEDDARIKNARNQAGGRLERKDVFYFNKKNQKSTRPIRQSQQRQQSREIETSIDFGQVTKAAVGGLLIVIAIGIVVGIIGAFHCPRQPVFQKIGEFLNTQKRRQRPRSGMRNLRAALEEQ